MKSKVKINAQFDNFDYHSEFITFNRNNERTEIMNNKCRKRFADMERFKDKTEKGVYQLMEEKDNFLKQARKNEKRVKQDLDEALGRGLADTMNELNKMEDSTLVKIKLAQGEVKDSVADEFERVYKYLDTMKKIEIAELIIITVILTITVWSII